MAALVDLGRRRRHDPQSRTHQHPDRKAGRLIHKRHPMNAPHVDQFYLSGCVGFSGTNGLNTAYAVRSRVAFNRAVKIGKAGRTYLGNDDGLRNYSESTRRDPFPGQYPPTDTGSSAIGLMKWWREIGIITGYEWVIDGGMDALFAAILRQPLLIGTVWYDDMMSTEPDGIIRANPVSDVNDDEGHEYLLTEVIPAGTRLYGTTFTETTLGYEQSWGEHIPGFGVDGRFFMPAPLAEELIFGHQGDVCAPRFLA